MTKIKRTNISKRNVKRRQQWHLQLKKDKELNKLYLRRRQIGNVINASNTLVVKLTNEELSSEFENKIERVNKELKKFIYFQDVKFILYFVKQRLELINKDNDKLSYRFIGFDLFDILFKEMRLLFKTKDIDHKLFYKVITDIISNKISNIDLLNEKISKYNPANTNDEFINDILFEKVNQNKEIILQNLNRFVHNFTKRDRIHKFNKYIYLHITNITEKHFKNKKFIFNNLNQMIKTSDEHYTIITHTNWVGIPINVFLFKHLPYADKDKLILDTIQLYKRDDKSISVIPYDWPLDIENLSSKSKELNKSVAKYIMYSKNIFTEKLNDHYKKRINTVWSRVFSRKDSNKVNIISKKPLNRLNYLYIESSKDKINIDKQDLIYFNKLINFVENRDDNFDVSSLNNIEPDEYCEKEMKYSKIKNIINIKDGYEAPKLWEKIRRDNKNLGLHFAFTNFKIPKKKDLIDILKNDVDNYENSQMMNILISSYKKFLKSFEDMNGFLFTNLIAISIIKILKYIINLFIRSNPYCICDEFSTSEILQLIIFNETNKFSSEIKYNLQNSKEDDVFFNFLNKYDQFAKILKWALIKEDSDDTNTPIT
ncbi:MULTISPECIES: hypothetical protein [unclassified Mycoplasma]|uniref:hypothetical protein n=1 Tax=unclassified Mycoplasma TaxID=2683645 RepID=UPI002B1DFF7C|nr:MULTISPECIES: hypothetical protein [unclassified Mycoplasma]MEA4134330.1 hypothetical protein [Mycoplasma sp. 2704]MEA4276288.1 hypothetical protein [Mycoplasma sp. 21DD0573]